MKNDLISNINRLHTTEMGAIRVHRNMAVDIDGITDFVRKCVFAPGSDIVRRGKNWYVYLPDCVVTINASSFTIITAHRRA